MNIDRRQFALARTRTWAWDWAHERRPRFCRCGRGCHCEERRSLPCGAGGWQCRGDRLALRGRTQLQPLQRSVDDKAALLAGVKDAKYKWTSLEYKDPTVRVVGPTAIVRFNFVGEQEFTDGKKTPQNLHILMNWQKQGNDWKLLSRAATKL